ncbi:MAG TPA: helix-turn-helix transcriptional regulator [Candidatus Kapabacteria bacterium]
MTITQIIGDNIRGYRSIRGWSQSRLAEEAKLHPNYIGYVERGERHVTVYKLADIAKVLRVKTYLFLIEGSYKLSATELNNALLIDEK